MLPDDAAPGQHDVRQPARDARRPRPAASTASKPATKELAPFLRELRPLVARGEPTFDGPQQAGPRSPGAANDATDLLQHLPRSQRIGQPGVPALDHGAAQGPAGARLPPALLAGPRRLVPRLRPERRPTTTRTATTRASCRSSTSSSYDQTTGSDGSLDAGPAVAAARRPRRRGSARRCPGAASQPRARRLEPVRGRDGSSTATPRRAARPMRRLLAIALVVGLLLRRARRSVGTGAGDDGGGYRCARSSTTRLPRDPGRGREDRRRRRSAQVESLDVTRRQARRRSSCEITTRPSRTSARTRAARSARSR